MRQVTYQPPNQVMIQRVRSIREATECIARVAMRRDVGGTAWGFRPAIFMVDVFHFSHCDTKVLRQTSSFGSQSLRSESHHWPI